MPRRARVECVSLRSSLVNLPVSIYGPLLERNIRPQSLAVHISNASGVNAYVGWTGMPSASSLAHFNSESSFETIEIDPQYAQSLGLSQDEVVDIGLLHDLPFANSVVAEPLTPDDWDIIDLHASHVESTLLSQVRVANIGQEIDVWVLGRTRVRLLVVSIDPLTKGNALLLTTNTQVAVAPKPHSSKKVSVPPKDDPNSAPKKPVPFRQFLRVLSPHLLPESTHDKHDGSEILALVSPYIFAELTHSPNPLIAYREILDSDSNAKQTITYHRCTVRRLRPPRDPSKLPKEPSAPPPRASQHASADSDKRDGTSTSNVDDEKEVYVGWSIHVPEKHIFPASIWDKLADWDNVQIILVPSEKATIEISRDLSVLEDGVVKSDSKPAHKSVENLAGVDDIINNCVNFCMDMLAYHASQNVVYGVPGLLVVGRSGTGKTSIVQAVAKIMQEDSRSYMHTIYVDFARYAEHSVSLIKSKFRYWFETAAWHCPTLLVFDNMHALLSSEQEHAESFRARHLTELFISIFSSSARAINPNTRGIIFIGTAPSKAALHPLLGTLHLFKDIVDLKTPSRDVRKKILAHFVQQRLDVTPDLCPESQAPLNYAAIASHTEGYAAVDLEDLVARAMHQSVIRADMDDNVTLDQVDFETAQADFVPLSLRDIQLQKSEVAWADIGGLDGVKRILRETLEWPTKYAAIFAQAPLRLRSGLLLYGYPGCGKTLLASAIAKECGLNFISVKGPEILNKYIGASEKAVRDLFERASAAKPCVLFFDEFDAIAPKRGHDSTGVTDRVVNQMLTEIDGAEGLDGVYVLAATSRPDLIDPALLRPGRLDKSLLCDMPNTGERKDILQAVSKKVTLSPEVDLDRFAQATEGFSGADLQALVYNAHLKVVHATIAAEQVRENGTNGHASESIEKPIKYVILSGELEQAKNKVKSRAEEAAFQKELRQIHLSVSKSGSAVVKAKAADSNPTQKREIKQEHMLYALKTTRPSVSAEERARLSWIYRAFVSDRSGDLPLPPETSGIGNRVSLM